MGKILSVIYFVILLPNLVFPDVFGKVVSTYEDLKSIKADFVQENYWAEPDISKISSGILWIKKKDNKIKLEYSEPKAQLLLVEIDKTTIYFPETNQVVIMDSFPIQNLLSPDKLVNNYLKYSEIIDKSENDSDYIYTIVPSDSALCNNPPIDFEFAKLILTIDKTSYLLGAIQYYDEQDNSVKFVFKNIEKDVKISDDIFSFKIPDNASVIDKRCRQKK
ncbi:MAG: hypothetical protein DRH57_07835 [Candidatus Cloacimonadota bacterium]|nr:MAG: hypothetical protein DRH57_07835 [Candidatus Cloacimonadota bacterium]